MYSKFFFYLLEKENLILNHIFCKNRQVAGNLKNFDPNFIMANERSIHGYNKSGVLEFLEGAVFAPQPPKLDHIYTPSKLNFPKKRQKNFFLVKSEDTIRWTFKRLTNGHFFVEFAQGIVHLPTTDQPLAQKSRLKRIMSKCDFNQIFSW